MSFPNVLIIEKDLEFARSINHALKKLGFTTLLKIDIEDPDEILDIHIPIHTIILNLELEKIEGLTLYSYLKKSKKFKNTTFSFLANDQETFELLDNMSLERAIFVNKKGEFDEILSQIINNINFPQDVQTEQSFILENFGNTSEISIGEILIYCHKTNFTGNIALFKNNDFGIFKIYLGELEEVNYKNYDKQSALKELHSWNNADFRLERHRFTVSDMKKLAMQTDNSVNIEQKPVHFINYSDLFIDIFCFLYSFLEQQIGKQRAAVIIQSNVDDYNQINTHPTLEFCADNEDTFTFETKLDENHIDKLIQLIENILEEAKDSEPLIEYHDFFEYIHELNPYLDKINFHKRINIPKNSEILE